MFDLKGKVAIVTGGNGGIGLGLASGLAKAGARVVVAARNAEKSKSAVEDLKRLGSDALAIATDVSDEQSVAALVDETMRRCGRLDILINNAGIQIRRPAQELQIEEWWHILNTNLTSCLLCCRSAYPHMKAGGGGKIINVGSILSFMGAPLTPAYNASKGGILQLTRSLAVGWAPDKIHVNAVLPGFVATPHIGEMLKDVPGLQERVIGRTPVGRWGKPEDFEGIAVFLASSASDFMVGAGVVMDGGYSVWI